MPLLSLEDVHTFYGDAQILHGVSLAIGAGEAVCLLGRNGRGKTTTIKSILGLAPVRHGRIVFDGTDITRWPTHLIARRGIAWVPDNRRVFRRSPWSGTSRWRSTGAAPAIAGDRWTLDRVYARFPILGPPPVPERRAPVGWGSPAGGDRPRAAHAPPARPARRALAGARPRIVEDIAAVVAEMREERIAILLVEQNSAMALALADRAYVIDDGHIVHSAPARELEADAARLHQLLAV